MSENKCGGCFKRKECRTKIINILVNNALKIYANNKELLELILRDGFKGYENMTVEELKKEFERQILQWDLKFNNKTMTNVLFVLPLELTEGEPVRHQAPLVGELDTIDELIDVKELPDERLTVEEQFGEEDLWKS